MERLEIDSSCTVALRTGMLSKRVSAGTMNSKTKRISRRSDAEQIRQLAALGVPPDLARRLSHIEATAMIYRMKRPPRRQFVPPAALPTLPAGAEAPPPLYFPPEDGEATDEQLRGLKSRLGGKYGNHHKRR